MIGYEQRDGKTLLVINDDMNAKFHLELIDHTVAVVSRSSEQLFTIKTDKRSHNRYIHATHAGKALHRCMAQPDDILKYFPNHSFHPRVHAYTLAVAQQHFDQLPPSPLHTYLNEAADHLVARLNACAAQIRMETRTPEFKAAIRSTQRSCNKNFKGVMKYLYGMFQKHGRLLGIRVDFGYKKTINFDPACTSITYEEAKRHREALVEEIRRRFKGVLAGYVWKFEYGLLKGYHSHFLIFLDNSKVREDVTIVKMLGEHWNNDITEGRGVYFNCNAQKSSYRFCSLGTLRHDDPQIWDGLERIAAYLTKPDYYVKLNMPGKDRALGKGGPPKLYAKKRGRPRRVDETRVNRLSHPRQIEVRVQPGMPDAL